MGLHLDLPPGLCIQRAEGRTDHPTLNGSNVVDVIHRYTHETTRCTYHMLHRCIQATTDAMLCHNLEHCVRMLPERVSSLCCTCSCSLQQHAGKLQSCCCHQVQWNVSEGDKARRLHGDLQGSPAAGHRQLCPVCRASNELPTSLLHLSLWCAWLASRLPPQSHSSTSQPSPTAAATAADKVPTCKGQSTAATASTANAGRRIIVSLKHCAIQKGESSQQSQHAWRGCRLFY